METQKRSALFTSPDFLAACGGLLGLFLGISAFGLIKYIVNFTLCFFWVLCKKNNSNNIVAPFHRRNEIDMNTIISIDEMNKMDKNIQWKIKY